MIPAADSPKQHLPDVGNVEKLVQKKTPSSEQSTPSKVKNKAKETMSTSEESKSESTSYQRLDKKVKNLKKVENQHGRIKEVLEIAKKTFDIDEDDPFSSLEDDVTQKTQEMSRKKELLKLNNQRDNDSARTRDHFSVVSEKASIDLDHKSSLTHEVVDALLEKIAETKPDMRHLLAAAKNVESLLDTVQEECETKILAPVEIIFREGHLPGLILDFVKMREAALLHEILKKHEGFKNIKDIDLSTPSFEQFMDQKALLKDDGTIALPANVLGYMGKFGMAVLKQSLPEELQRNPHKIDMNNLPAGVTAHRTQEMTHEDKKQVEKMVKTYFTLAAQLFILKNLIKAQEQQSKNTKSKSATQPIHIDSHKDTDASENIKEKDSKEKHTKRSGWQETEAKFAKKREAAKAERSRIETHEIYLDKLKKKNATQEKNIEDFDRDFLKKNIGIYTEMNFDIKQMLTRLQEFQENEANHSFLESIHLNTLMESFGDDINSLVHNGASLVEIFDFIHRALVVDGVGKMPIRIEGNQIEKLGKFVTILSSIDDHQ